MSKKRKIFDKKFVHFMWDDSLEGKKGFFGDYIDKLVDSVENGGDELVCEGPGDSEFPFSVLSFKYCFFYYDPLYDVKLAWKQGKQVQGRYQEPGAEWQDCSCPAWSDTCEYRVKPEKKWRPFKDIRELKNVWSDKAGLSPDYAEPMIWVRSKSNTTSTYLITHYCGNMGVVFLCGYLNVGLEQLFADYTFLDGTPCGVEE